MTRRRAGLPGSLVLASILSLSATAGVFAGNGPYDPQLVVPTPVLRSHACGIDHAVPRRRGIAILSPVESPDHWNPAVGGKPRLIPYYPDYCVHPWHGPRIFVPDNSPNYAARFAGVPGADASSVEAVAESQTPGYGNYSGARQDESNLLHLGGFSGSDAATDRTNGTPDVIDLIQGGH
ncbi:MAG TPA: hypothetical protein VIK18_14740 [Pirellulales bacterium]